VITRDEIKTEIDKVKDEFLPALYRIVKALEQPSELSNSSAQGDWKAFIAETYGSTAADPLERGEQGRFEFREFLE
jgi:hypothetical protein